MDGNFTSEDKALYLLSGDVMWHWALLYSTFNCVWKLWLELKG